MRCRTHDVEMRMVRCPDGKPGCAVAHFVCQKCLEERLERDVLEALQQANGLLDERGEGT